MWKQINERKLELEEFEFVDWKEELRKDPDKNGRTSALCHECLNPQIYDTQYLKRGQYLTYKCHMCGVEANVYKDSDGWLFKEPDMTYEEYERKRENK